MGVCWPTQISQNTVTLVKTVWFLTLLVNEMKRKNKVDFSKLGLVTCFVGNFSYQPPKFSFYCILGHFLAVGALSRQKILIFFRKFSEFFNQFHKAPKLWVKIGFKTSNLSKFVLNLQIWPKTVIFAQKTVFFSKISTLKFGVLSASITWSWAPPLDRPHPTHLSAWVISIWLNKHGLK